MGRLRVVPLLPGPLSETVNKLQGKLAVGGINGHFFLVVFLRVMHDGPSEGGTTGQVAFYVGV